MVARKKDYSGSQKRTCLNLAYNTFIDELRLILDEERLEVYDLLTNELEVCGYKAELDEYKYKVTNGENPNIVLYDILNRIDGTTITCLFSNTLKRYIEDDNMSRFHY